MEFFDEEVMKLDVINSANDFATLINKHLCGKEDVTIKEEEIKLLNNLLKNIKSDGVI